MPDAEKGGDINNISLDNNIYFYLIFPVPPVCKVNKDAKLPILNGKKEIELLCEVMANPPPINFTWALNSTAGLVVLPQVIILCC